MGIFVELDRLAEDVGLDVAEAVAVGVEDLGVGAVAGGPESVDVGRVGRDVQDPQAEPADRERDQAEDAEQNADDLLARRARVCAGAYFVEYCDIR